MVTIVGIDCTALQALALAKMTGVDFARTIQLGHQELHVGRAEVKSAFVKFSIPVTELQLDKIFSTRYADDLFRHLGAVELDSIDAAGYESASIVHDMNQPIPEFLKSRYSLVFDGGTLEHVFNFPVASSNVIKMAAVGGHILSVTPANNLCGHGFYQFSPELFFRVFGAPNGCEINALFMADTAPHRAWFRVADPRVLGRRVSLHHFYSTMMVMFAAKLSDEVDEKFIPQQSDYEFGAWQDQSASASVSRVRRIKARMRAALPVSVWSRLMTIRDLLTHTGYRQGYTRVFPDRISRLDRVP